jgi:hypothetical protein
MPLKVPGDSIPEFPLEKEIGGIPDLCEVSNSEYSWKSFLKNFNDQNRRKHKDDEKNPNNSKNE